MSALYQEEIAGCCRQLRLSSILAEYAMTTECDTNQEYLYQVLSRTIAYRRDCRIGKLIGSAGFPKPYDFSQFRADEVEFQTGCSLESLKSLEFMHQGRNIIMYGDNVIIGLSPSDFRKRGSHGGLVHICLRRQ